MQVAVMNRSADQLPSYELMPIRSTFESHIPQVHPILRFPK